MHVTGGTAANLGGRVGSGKVERGATGILKILICRWGVIPLDPGKKDLKRLTPDD